MGNRVQRVRTTVSEAQVAEAIMKSWKELFGGTPSKEQVSMVLAQNALETGSRKSMWNYNIGNITTNGKDSYDYFDDLTTDEQVKPGVWEKKNLKYRAYPSLEAGAKDYLKLLSGKRYSNAWEHIKNPNPTAFSKALKQSGYYTANEAPYTKTLTSLFGKFNKSDAYEVARSGKVPAAKDLGMPKDNKWIEEYMARHKDFDPYKALSENKPKTPNQTTPNQTTPAAPSGLDGILNRFLQQVAASERGNKRLYKKYLPSHNINIVVSAEYTDAIEFSRILCTALNEELLADAFTHADEHNVEVQCSIQGPKEECLNVVAEITRSVTEAFKKATRKIGGISVTAHLAMDKKPSYQPINITAAANQYRKFLLKFV